METSIVPVIFPDLDTAKTDFSTLVDALRTAGVTAEAANEGDLVDRGDDADRPDRGRRRGSSACTATGQMRSAVGCRKPSTASTPKDERCCSEIPRRSDPVRTLDARTSRAHTAGGSCDQRGHRRREVPGHEQGTGKTG
jgi:hypothetical protein